MKSVLFAVFLGGIVLVHQMLSNAPTLTPVKQSVVVGIAIPPMQAK